jgi:hypothetical protein
MNRSTLRLLGIIVAVLVVALVLIESGDEGDTRESGQLLLPDFRDSANSVDRMTITRANEDAVVITKDGKTWRVEGRGGYPANIDSVRAVLLAIADAKVLEAKTDNPDLHGRLGVDSPIVEGSKGTLVTTSAGEISHGIIFGNTAQGNYRYARIASEDQSWLIDQNPDIPATAGDWLIADIIDIDASRIKSATITHADGEIIRIDKFSESDTDFQVADVPDGRELSYSTVANGIGGALNDLDLDDVRLSVPADDSVTTTFETFDGVTIVAHSIRSGDENWISLDVSAADEGNAEAVEISSRVNGWQYKVADYKANLLTRRWEDILKAETEEP